MVILNMNESPYQVDMKSTSSPSIAKQAIDSISPSVPAYLCNFPALANDEIVVGRTLGSGGFCTVAAVRRLQLINPDSPQVNEDLALTFLNPYQINCRQRLQERFSDYERAYFSNRHQSGQRGVEPNTAAEPQNKPPRIALKRLRSNLSKAKYVAGLKDLTQEVELLGLLNNSHPHIIGLHAVGLESDQSITFAIIDQLHCTLNNKIYKWRETLGLGIFITKKTLQDLWLERMVILMQVASALAFLHEKGIIHRDVTTANIGFDSDNCVKLFDFGLARIMGDDKTKSDLKNIPDNDGKGGSEVEDENAIYNMSEETGTLRFMAPEVYMNQPYGAKVDVYSLSILMYQVLSLLQPFGNVPPSQFISSVIKGGLRPTIDASWPMELKDLLAKMWSSDSAQRPKSKDLVASLERMLRGTDDDLYPMSSLQRLFSEDKIACDLPQCMK